MTAEQNSTSVQEREDLSQIIQIDQAKVAGHLNGLGCRSMHETLNKMLDAEATVLHSVNTPTQRRTRRTAA